MDIGLAQMRKNERRLNTIAYRYSFVKTSEKNNPFRPELDISFSINQKPEIRLYLKGKNLYSAQLPLFKGKTGGKKVAHSFRFGY